MIESRPLLLLLGWALTALLQLVLYLYQRRTGDATVVDVGWAASLVGIGRGEDARYQELRQRWEARGNVQTRFFVFFQAQAFLAAVVSLPILLAASNEGRLGVLAFAGAALWLVAAPLEAVADRQLARFKQDSTQKGATLRSGPWRYSRHPNYFFQWLTWVGYALVALEAPQGWLGLLAPALMLYLILCVTGVPPAEESSLRSRGDDYRTYQRETSVFVPWFPRGRPT